jgi:hypothetical protein
LFNLKVLKMKKYFKGFVGAALIALALVSFSACNADDEVAPLDVNVRAVQATVTVSGVISSDTTWTSNNVYQLDGKVYVSNGATLTIEAGTIIEGLASTEPEDASALIITRGSKIMAEGAVCNPIVFTAENGQKGGWGGLVLLGNARINQSAAQYIEGIDPATVPDGVDVTYGSTVDDYNAESSGALSYVRVEYAGATIAVNNELNSFTFGGVGSGTQLDHLQAYQGADDAFEFFGGTVNAKYLISTAADDDAFDFDLGYTGKLQFLVAVINPCLSYSANPNGIESDNDEDSSPNTPLTHAVISNITIAGTSTGTVAGGGVGATHALLNAANIRRNSGITIVNGIFYGYPGGIVNNGGATAAIVLDTNVGTTVPTSASAYTGFTNLPASNITVAGATNLVLVSPFGTYNGGTSYKNGGLTPSSGAALNTAVYDASQLDAFFETPYFLGGANDVEDTEGANWLEECWVIGDQCN